MKVSVSERIASGIDRIWQLDNVLYRQQSPYQEILIGSGAQGIGLFCNGERQSTELTQLAYHEAQIIPAFLLAKRCESVLVIGSSEGVVSQLALKAGATSVVHVDIDEQCLAACAEWLPYGYTIDDLENAKAHAGSIKVTVQDGEEFVCSALRAGTSFDVIALDLPDEDVTSTAQQNRLYSVEFLKKLKELLTPEGALITQAGNSCLWRSQTLTNAWLRMRRVFAGVVYYESDAHDWSWIICGRDRWENSGEQMVERLAGLAYRPLYIDKLTIKKGAILPKSIREEAEKC
jgi:spermidine synthase